MRIAIRGYLGPTLQWTRRTEIGLNKLAAELGTEHAQAMADGMLDMVEIEFLDEPDVNQRFFRIGTNPAGMRLPVEIKL